MAGPEISVDGAREWLADGHMIDVWNRRIFVRTAGPTDAPPLLLLHGFPTSSLDWAPIWTDLARGHRLIAFDFLGFGFSDKPRKHQYNLIEQANIARAVATAEGVSAVHLLAHDYGVSVGQELLARMHTGGRLEILSCCFLNGGLLPESHRPRPIQRLLAGRFGWLFARLFNKKRFARSFSAVFGPSTRPDKGEIDGFWNVIRYHNGNRLMHRLIHYMADRRKYQDRWRAVLVDPPAPIALINGSLDPVSGRHLADAVAALNPAIPITHLADIGHYPQVEAPDRVIAAYRAFLSGIRPR